MSSIARKYVKEIKANSMKFPPDMYNNIVGSLVITNWILSQPEQQPATDFIRSVWRRLKRTGLECWIDDEDFIAKTLEKFRLKPHYNQFAMAISKGNVLFAPYDPDTKQVYPIREDGIYQPTLRHGKIYPVSDKADTTTLTITKGSEAENNE